MGGKAGREFCQAGVPVMLETAYAQHVQAIGLGQIADDAAADENAPRKRGRPAKKSDDTPETITAPEAGAEAGAASETQADEE